MSESLVIDGVGPMPVERPTTIADLCAIVRRCAETKTAIYPVGGGTMLDYGMPPVRIGIALSTANLNQIIDYPARDLTITVEAGMTMRKLQETLAAENQWLPIDVPDPERATIGGAIACDVSGPRRLGYGTLRDYIIGITVVNDRGEECKAGGRVVKNVAGYDMMKLYTGALGTLGVITQVTLKVKPRPEATGEVAASFIPGEELTSVFEAIATTKTQPVWFSVHQHQGRGRGWPNGPVESRWQWTAFLVFDGSDEAVRWQEEKERDELTKLSNSVYVSPRDAARFDSAYASWPRQYLRVTVPSNRVAELAVFAGGLSELIGIAAHANGLVEITPYNAESHPEWDSETAGGIVRELRRKAVECDGTLVVQNCPTEWKKQIPIWGRPPADLALQKAVKRALDPHNLFNPGRFVTDCF